MKSTVKLLVLISLSTLMSCQTRSMGSPIQMSAAALSEDYERSSSEVRRKYDGKEIIVTGYAATAASTPKQGEDQHSVFLLTQKGGSVQPHVTCWFTRDQAIQFSQVMGGEHLAVKGVFSGETGLELRFCKLVKVE